MILVSKYRDGFKRIARAKPLIVQHCIYRQQIAEPFGQITSAGGQQNSALVVVDPAKKINGIKFAGSDHDRILTSGSNCQIVMVVYIAALRRDVSVASHLLYIYTFIYRL